MMIPAYNKKGCAAFHSRRESMTGESPASFPEENTAMPYSGFEPDPTRLHATRSYPPYRLGGGMSTVAISSPFVSVVKKSAKKRGNLVSLWRPANARVLKIKPISPANDELAPTEDGNLPLQFNLSPRDQFKLRAKTVPTARTSDWKNATVVAEGEGKKKQTTCSVSRTKPVINRRN
ncbi:hypothetical protein TNCV_2654921 [Trichonephila clavipes]|nr:hypothetical protein TNCV_2654921 [Trichonephila clavipes]